MVIKEQVITIDKEIQLLILVPIKSTLRIDSFCV